MRLPGRPGPAPPAAKEKSCLVSWPAGSDTCRDARDHTDGHRNEQPSQRERDGDREPFRNQLGDLIWSVPGLAKVSGCRIGQPTAVLDEERVIDTDLFAVQLIRFFGRVVA